MPFASLSGTYDFLVHHLYLIELLLEKLQVVFLAGFDWRYLVMPPVLNLRREVIRVLLSDSRKHLGEGLCFDWFQVQFLYQSGVFEIPVFDLEQPLVHGLVQEAHFALLGCIFRLRLGGLLPLKGLLRHHRGILREFRLLFSR